MALLDRLAASLGYAPASPATPPTKGKAKPFGGRLAPPPQSVTRFLLSDIEDAIIAADQGNLRPAAQLAKAIRRDGKTAGVLSTRTDGLVRLPIEITGREDMATELASKGVFARKFPVPELAKLAGDGILLGVGIGEMVADPTGKVDTILRRLDPEYLQFRWAENRWYYLSMMGPLPIEPGDGRWVLHTPGGEDQPWAHGLWMALGKSYVAKDHAFMGRQSYAATLANPARVAYSPAGATERQRGGMVGALKAWGMNAVFSLPEGWDAKLLESNGRGFECFQAIIAEANEEIIIAIAGQLVSTNGTSGFGSGELHKTIRADLIQATGDALALTINTQGIPPWVNRRYGGDALAQSPEVAWDVTPPADHKAQADTIGAVGDGISKADAALLSHGLRVKAQTLADRFAVDVEPIPGALPPAPIGVDPTAPPNAPPPMPATDAVEEDAQPDAAAVLADLMTQHGVDRCEHGSLNRCRLCGVERDRVLIPSKRKGQPATWGIKWRPIDAAPAPIPAPAEAP
jgi:hypothetical protein